jgi:[methyl-Co(III) methanol-specific corrinoid protein]:coenzyme M methyltransferase
MTEKERFLNAIFLRSVDRPPVASVTQTGTIELMNATGAFWPDAHRNPEKMASLAASAHDLAGFESVRIPFGIHAEAEALGCRVNYYEGTHDRTPVVEAPTSESSINWDADPGESASTKVVIDAVRILKTRYPSTPTIVGVLAPFSLTGHIRSVAKLMRELIKVPDEVKITMELSSQFIKRYINRLESAGADVITLVEPTATGENLGPAFFERFAFPSLEQVVSACKKPVILHICGNSTSVLHLMVKTGVKGVSIDHKVNMARAKEIVGEMGCVIGNINPVDMMMKKEEYIQNEAHRALEEHADIVAPGCGLAPRTPTANLQSLTTAVKNYNKPR